MTIHFIGAGPGAPDLLTIRARDILAQCPVCLYAGSIVHPAILQHCPAEARIVDTAPMTLDEIEQEFVSATIAGHDVARLHSGDLSIYSAVAEQISRLQKRGIAYTLTPGVPAFAAAAAALRMELTIPELAQSVVLTRIGGRASKMPDCESLEKFGATRATLAIHLAVHRAREIADRLIPFYGDDCPAVVVARASWPDETVVETCLGDLADVVAAEGIERTALILIGRALRPAGHRESALYDPSYRRRYRGAGA